jgi:renalase
MNRPEIYDLIIVGAGLTGLYLSWELSQKYPALKILMLEKSKSCGGRMATRRADQIHYDHGAQFIKSTADSQKIIEFWNQNNLTRDFPTSHFQGICAASGITQLAKSLAAFSNIVYNFKVHTLSKEHDHWLIKNEENQFYKTRQLVLTCPLPQSIEILKKSHLFFNSELLKITYDKAIVFLFETKSDIPFSYIENPCESIFSITAQHKKGNSPTPAWTVVMRPEWSEKHFDLTDEEIFMSAHSIIENYFVRFSDTCDGMESHPKLEGMTGGLDRSYSLKIKNHQVKKWRYSQPQSVYRSLFEKVEPGIYLAGDAFGGGSLNGALRSANSLCQHFIQTLKTR